MLNYMKWKLKQIMKCITLNNLQKQVAQHIIKYLLL